MRKVLYILFFCLGNIMAANLILGDIKEQEIEERINKQNPPTGKSDIDYYIKYYEKYKDTEAGPVTANLIWQGYHMMCNTEESEEKREEKHKKEQEYFQIFLNSFYDDSGRLLDDEAVIDKLLELPSAVYTKWLVLEKEYKGNISKLLQALLTDDTKLDNLLKSLDDL